MIFLATLTILSIRQGNQVTFITSYFIYQEQLYAMHLNVQVQLAIGTKDTANVQSFLTGHSFHLTA